MLIISRTLFEISIKYLLNLYIKISQIGDIAQLVEYLPRMHKAIVSNPQHHKKQNKKTKVDATPLRLSLSVLFGL